MSSLGPRLRLPAPLTGGRRCTARQQSARPARWLLQRRAAPAPQGNPALRGSCCGQWTRSRRAGTRCRPRKGACRSLGREGVNMTSSWSLPPLPPPRSLDARGWGPGSSPHLLCRQAPAGSGLGALEESRWRLETTPAESWWGGRVACAGGGGWIWDWVWPQRGGTGERSQRACIWGRSQSSGLNRLGCGLGDTARVAEGLGSPERVRKPARGVILGAGYGPKAECSHR